MSKRNIEAVYELSPMQQGMLFESIYRPESGVYVEQMYGTLRGDLDVEAFRRAWQAVLDRHTILRTSFAWKKLDRVLQVVQRQVELPFTAEDWRVLSPAEQAARLDAQLNEERRRGFNLAQAPLMRVALLHTADDAYTFVWSHHHILLDGWSLPLLLKEVFAYYEAFSRGQTLELAPPRPYRDYIAWLKKQDMAAAEAYWRKTLAGFTAPTPLAVDDLPVAGNGAAHSELEIRVSHEVTGTLEALARQHHLTLSTLVQGAWALLLSRYSGEDDVVFGLTVSGRPADLPGAESMVGLFINTLPVRVRISNEQPVIDWLKALQAQTVEMRQYEYSPLVEVQRWSDVEPGQPLFNSILVFENYPLDEAVLMQRGGLRVEDVHNIEQTEFPLTVVSAPGEELPLKISYDAQRFSADTILRMLGHLETLLEGIAADPRQAVGVLPLLPHAEQQQILVEWNRTSAPYPADQCAHELFETQAARTPDAPALVFEGETMSYAELNRRANQLAHTLQARGVGPETLVGLCVERSFEMIVGILGVLKAGGAYLPLDPTFPPERLGYMLNDAGVRLVLTQAHLVKRLPEHNAGILRLDADWEEIARASGANPQSGAAPGNLAYVIYTSGSTGRPKGVLLAHRGLVNLIPAYCARFGLKPGVRFLQFSTVGFDGSVPEVFATLASGATLVLGRRETLLSPSELHALLRRERVNVATLPPALLSVLPADDLPDLEHVMSVGDRLTGEVAAKWKPGRHLHNGYGPTENTVCSVWHEVTDEDIHLNRYPIGRPFPNVRAYVLDAQLRPVPVGVPGELCVGGVALARGYLNRPELTAERFIADPFGAGGRLYRTGDRVRWLPDGTLEFLGRLDQQVKVRGFRVELGEIEAVLVSHPAVEQAAVKALGESPAETWLAAYIVPVSGATPDPAALRAYLAERLPDYMVPTAYVVMDALPLNASGKVDRKALPAPEGAQLASAEYVAPRTPVEAGLAGIYASVLKVERVGVHDDFFALGGHSLLATQLVSRVRETFQVELPIRDLFDAPTVAGLAERVERALREEAGLDVPPLVPVEFEADPPLSFAQQRLWFLDQLAPGNLFYNLPLAVRLSGALDVEALQRALNTLVERHETLRTTFRAEKGEPVQVIADDLTLDLPLDDLTDLPESEREAEAQRLAEQDARTPFDLAAGPLLRARLIKLAEDEHLAVLVLHHIIADGWSLGVLVEEMARLYAAYASGQTPALPPLPVQYADYAHWQREWLQGEVLERQLAYWRKQLEGAPALLELPTDRPRPAVQTSNGATLPVTLPTDLSSQVRAFSQSQGATLFMVLLAAFQALLSRYSGQTDISVGTAIAGRGRPEIEGLIGFFVNTLVMRTDLSGEPSFKELVARVKEVALGAYAHQDVPFEMLVEKLQPRRDLSHTPFFQVGFALQNTPVPALELPGLRLTPVEVDSGAAQYDLLLALAEEDGVLTGGLTYNTDLFERGTVERLMAHYRRLLEAAVAEPERPVADLPLLTEAERQQMLVEWNRTDAPYPQQTVHALFEGWVEQQPEAAALVFGERVLTYRELNERANKLAHALRERGVGPETVVGIAVERSFEMVVGVLGVLKAGGAYLPIDPTYPAGRIAFMLADSGVRLLLTQAHLVERLPEHDAETLRLDADWEQVVAGCPADNPDVPLTPDALAYVIYTSGSTGQPKGALLAHRGLANLAAAQRETFGVGPGKRVLQFAPFSFDASVWELVMALANGATLVLAEQATLASGPELLRLLAAQRVNVVTLPPSLLAVLEPGELPELEVVVAAGERCTEAIVAAWSPGRRLFNAYGPTETTVCASWYECADEEPGGPPIGRPLPNVRLYVLDSRGQPVPVGVAGELHVGGVGLARGYHNRPELTAEKFIPNPFGEGRLYRTGDLVRWRADGNLEFLGRIDHQVKLRGFRIELGEIEAALRAQPEVADAVVLAHEERLVAYLVPAEGSEPQPALLRAALRQRLPEYMVPAQYVVLERFPMTPANKVDRAALPKPDGERPVLTSEYVAPRTPTEEKLAELVSELLGLEKVGVYDDFFELGGHSLLATQLMARVREAFGVEVPLRTLFETPHLAGLAEAVDELKAQGPAPEMPAIVPLARERYRTSRTALARGGNGMSEPEAEKDATHA